jgi:hypothetical protein
VLIDEHIDARLLCRKPEEHGCRGVPAATAAIVGERTREREEASRLIALGDAEAPMDYADSPLDIV